MGISGVKLCCEVLGSELSKVQDEQNNPVHPGAMFADVCRACLLRT
jgi:hypothetical protein